MIVAHAAHTWLAVGGVALVLLVGVGIRQLIERRNRAD